MMAQTKTVVTQFGEKVIIHPNANNGLTANSGYIQFGGELIQPSLLTTNATNTLAIEGLMTGTANDNILVTDTDGILKTISRSSLTGATTKGSLLSTNATITINSGNNKLWDTDASLDITPGTANQILTTNTSTAIEWKNTAQITGTMNLVRKTADYTISETTDNVVLVDAAGGNIIITIPDGITAGRFFTIKRVDSSNNTVTLLFSGGTIDESDTFIAVGIKSTYQVITEGSNRWQTITRF
ncbi:hypothetical protein ACFFWB_16280 [Flavobacterium procerum]